MSEEEESLEDVGEDIGSALPHTPPLGIKAEYRGCHVKERFVYLELFGL